MFCCRDLASSDVLICPRRGGRSSIYYDVTRGHKSRFRKSVTGMEYSSPGSQNLRTDSIVQEPCNVIHLNER